VHTGQHASNVPHDHSQGETLKKTFAPLLSMNLKNHLCYIDGCNDLIFMLLQYCFHFFILSFGLPLFIVFLLFSLIVWYICLHLGNWIKFDVNFSLIYGSSLQRATITTYVAILCIIFMHYGSDCDLPDLVSDFCFQRSNLCMLE